MKLKNKVGHDFKIAGQKIKHITAYVKQNKILITVIVILKNGNKSQKIVFIS
jgi:hypothetical protein